jgi:hypothetical protein
MHVFSSMAPIGVNCLLMPIQVDFVLLPLNLPQSTVDSNCTNETNLWFYGLCALLGSKTL